MKIICIGLNYRDHAAEMGKSIPEEPVVFMKPDSALIKKNKPFFLPAFSKELHYETEIVIRISKLGKSISEKYAYRYFDDFTIGIDITARDIQSRHKSLGLPWEIAKGFDGSAPVGKFVPIKSVKDINNINFRLDINNKVVQRGNTKNMIFSISRIISYVSQFFTLKTGDLIFTGTPSGIGLLRKNDNLVAYLEEEPLLDFMIK